MAQLERLWTCEAEEYPDICKKKILNIDTTIQNLNFYQIQIKKKSQKNLQ